MLLIAGGIAYGITAAASRGAGPSAVMVLGIVVGWIGYGLVALVVSGALAALVAIEAGLQSRAGRANPSDSS